jgi:hypothetical protein
MTKKLGTSGRVIRRKELKPESQLSDKELLAQAMRDALKWQAEKARGRLH